MANRFNPAAFALVACLALIAQADEKRADAVAILETPETFQLTVPISRLVMTFPRSGFNVDLIDEETDGPRYFSFSDPATGALISGWFEPADAYKGIESIRKEIFDVARKVGLPKPANDAVVPIGRWEAVTYDIAMPVGSNTHIRAELTELGTWIDLHISVTAAGSIESARKAAQDILESVQIAATAEE